ncbi:hypothetical protein CYMTET_13241 [Cymbomonas tetramitiformis]|uniref:Uncharacterized protein n=1 Tax=Cymbomonas tetramitiformis TaxID=36881 RepID=A0AAE0GJ30_9CHLO|nr:hypothetical protein CYMTET_13241 [Cymbomonas tetramitiformis]
MLGNSDRDFDYAVGKRTASDVATTEEAERLQFLTKRANTFLEGYVQMQRDIAAGTFELKEKTTWVLHEAPFEVTGPMMPAPSGGLSANGRDAEVLIVDEPMADANGNERGYTDAQLADYVQGLRDSVAVHVRPVPRPIYIGAQKNTIGRRARDHLAQYVLGETDDPDYDVSYSKMKKEEKCLRWLTCGTFKLTSASQKEAQNADSRLSKEKASKPESFRLHQRIKQRWIPGEQYDLLVKRVIASDMSKSFEPPQHRTPKLLLRDAIMSLEDEEDKENAGAEEGERSDEEASLSSLSDDDDQMCE